MYAYFAYAIARGEIPYRDIVLPHPPIGFMFYSLPVLVFGNNLIVLNLFSISIFALSTVLCYLIARKIFDSRKNCLAVLSALVFALWPGTFVEAFTSPLEVILTFFVLLSFYFYVLYRKSGLFKYTFVSGLFFGISLFVKPTSLFMVIALMFFELVLMIMSKNLRGYLKWFILLLVGGLISSLACLFLITGVFNAFDLFVLQAVKFQTSLQDFLTVSERISYFHWYLVAHIPLLTLSVAGLFPLQKYRFNQMLPAIVAIISMVTEVSLVNTYYHHLYYLTPILSISAIIGAEKLWSSLTSFVKSQNHLKPVTLAMLFIVFVSFVAYADAATKEFNSVFPWWSPNVFSVSNVTATERIVGAIVASMSTPNERIWTSDGSIAFFSGRLIEAPDIQEWPVQVFYIRTWLIYTSALENGSPKKGLLQPSEFVSSWDKHHTRVLVFIRGQGWIPYPDELLWNGYSGLTGVKDYVIENYQLAKVIPHPTSGYTYEVWVSKT
jgi:4-amino-4-deoxy-L-arabinose transferase-like glycosyltransferase